MLRSKIIRELNELDGTLIDLQERGCSISEVRDIETNPIPNNLSIKRNAFLILYDDPYVGVCASSDEEEDEETDEPDDEDLTNEQKFIRDWGRQPLHPCVVGSLAYEYVCPAITGLPFDQKEFNTETGLCSANPSTCSECKKRFWKSKYKKPEKKEA